MLDGLPGADNRQSLVEKHRGVHVLEYKDRGCTYYRQHFRHAGSNTFLDKVSVLLYGGMEDVDVLVT